MQAVAESVDDDVSCREARVASSISRVERRGRGYAGRAAIASGEIPKVAALDKWTLRSITTTFTTLPCFGTTIMRLDVKVDMLLHPTRNGIRR